MQEFEFAKEYFAPDEHVVWTGKPGKGYPLYFASIVSIILGIFLIYGGMSMLFSGDDLMFLIFSSVITVLGLYFIVEPLIIKITWLNTAYVITNKAVYRKTFKKVSFLHGKTLPPVEVDKLINNNITIRFGCPRRHRVVIGIRTIHFGIFFHHKRYYIDGYGDNDYTYFALENISDDTRAARNAIAAMERQ